MKLVIGNDTTNQKKTRGAFLKGQNDMIDRPWERAMCRADLIGDAIDIIA